jgi:transposase
MDIVLEHCAGIDVHKRTVVVCRLTPSNSGERAAQTQTFGTTTQELLRLCDWLEEGGCTHVGLESTGDYWKPVYNLLEGAFEVWLLNAQHIKAVPGRKTDVKDAQWIAELLAHGLVRPSFIPPRHQRELRDLTRYRVSFVRERATLINQVQKLLEPTFRTPIRRSGEIMTWRREAEIAREQAGGEWDTARPTPAAGPCLERDIPVPLRPQSTPALATAPGRPEWRPPSSPSGRSPCDSGWRRAHQR